MSKLTNRNVQFQFSVRIEKMKIVYAGRNNNNQTWIHIHKIHRMLTINASRFQCLLNISTRSRCSLVWCVFCEENFFNFRAEPHSLSIIILTGTDISFEVELHLPFTSRHTKKIIQWPEETESTHVLTIFYQIEHSWTLFTSHLILESLSIFFLLYKKKCFEFIAASPVSVMILFTFTNFLFYFAHCRRSSTTTQLLCLCFYFFRIFSQVLLSHSQPSLFGFFYERKNI